MIENSEYGTTIYGFNITKYILKNSNGMELELITYGGRITSLKVPDKDGKLENVVLGFDSLEEYESENPYFGALIGRFGNRIARGKFSLDGEEYILATNDGSNHLHGGSTGFDKVVWIAETLESSENPSLKLTYLSKDGEEGYPGNLNIAIIYTLREDNSVKVSYRATTDKKTIVNLTQHSYFNLTGNFSNDVLNHEVVIDADNYLPVNETLIPTGEIRNVVGTPFDFRTAKNIGKEINQDDEQLKIGSGYDHCWVLNGQKGHMHFASSAYDQKSGRLMEVFSEEPGVQFYTGNFLDGTLNNPAGGTYKKRTGFCLETQHFPDTPNQVGNFPSVTLDPDETYISKTIFKFSVK